MRNKLMSLMPEFQLIADHDLRKKSLTVWLEAMQKGGWKIEDLQEMPFTLLIPNTDINLVDHTRAVTLCSLRIAEVLIEAYHDRISLSRDHLISGALLHDVGKMFEYCRENGRFLKSREGTLLRHPISGAAFADRFGMPQEVLHIIASHSKEGDGARRTVEAVIVNHADFVNFESLRLE